LFDHVHGRRLGLRDLRWLDRQRCGQRDQVVDEQRLDRRERLCDGVDVPRPKAHLGGISADRGLPRDLLAVGPRRREQILDGADEPVGGDLGVGLGLGEELLTIGVQERRAQIPGLGERALARGQTRLPRLAQRRLDL
jgi:hypothetical protein